MTAGPWGDPPPPGSRFGPLVGAGTSGLLAEVIERYAGEWRRLVLVAASIVVPAALLQAFFTRDIEMAPVDPEVAPTDPELAAMSTLLVVGFVVAVIVTPLVNGLLLRAAAERDTEVRSDLGTLYRTATSYFTPMLALLTIVTATITLGFLAFIVPGVYLAVRLHLAPPAMIVEGETIIGALLRSWRLTAGAFWRLLGAIVLGVVSVVMLSLVLSMPLMLLRALIGTEAWLAQGLLSGVLSAALWPVLMVLAVVLYLHRRVETEGYTPAELSADLVAHETRG